MLRAPAAPLFLGIDTGGTCTDAVLWSASRGVVAKAKALTTRHDLAIGIGGAVDAALAASGVASAAIKLVSMSTTLATNALVEGQGERAALVMIGFTPADFVRGGLDKAAGADPVVFCPGGHDAMGAPNALDLSALDAALPKLGESVSAFAVAAMFAVRNPAHELAARDLIRQRASQPVTMSHELSARLGGPKRALTTLLNARLISMIDRLVAATEAFLSARRIEAPLMVVRGDGALVSAAFAKARPIETILSGPAASLVGAHHMTGLADAIVSDIGGTTTDVGVLSGGRPRIDPEGARVGDFRTMVEAVAMRTFGLGGDSEVTLERRGLEDRLRLGPRRLVPLSLAAALHGEAMLRPLEKQSLAPHFQVTHGRFAMRAGLPENLAAGLNAGEAALYSRLERVPRALEDLLGSALAQPALARLVARGLAQIVGFTPSDAAHVLGRQTNWNADAARLGAELFRRHKDARGKSIAASAEEISRRVLTTLTRRSAEAIFETAFAEDGLAASVDDPLVQHALDGKRGVARVEVALDRSVIGLGASASLHYAALPALIGNACLTPPHADVANALGAVVGHVSIRVEANVSQPVEGRFRVVVGEVGGDFAEEAEALAWAERRARALALQRATTAGTDAADVTVERELRAAVIEGRRMFIDATISATATGRPRIAGAAMLG